MLLISSLLMLIIVKRSTLDMMFETKTAAVGEDVEFTCIRDVSKLKAHLFWIRHISGNMPEVLGGTRCMDYEVINKTPHFTAKQGPGVFLLQISKTELSDSGVYYCIEVDWLNMTFIKGVSLTIKDSTVIQLHAFVPVAPEESASLQCSILSDSENTTCAEYDSVHWFRAGSDGSHPSYIYTQRRSSDECEKSPEAPSPHKCVYNFCQNISASDAGTYYCAVATCGEVLFGRGKKLQREALNMWDVHKANTAVFLLCATLAISLIANAFLIYIINKKKNCDCCKEVATVSTDQQRDEQSLVYTAPTFSRRKAGKAGRANDEPADRETVYSDVRHKQIHNRNS